MSELTGDITQFNDGSTVFFSAVSTAADIWMRNHYDGIKIYFSLPEENSKVLAFTESARDEGFTIGVL
jgi:hypothetical protein